MTLATMLSRTSQGLNAPQVRVEVDVGAGLPAFSVVGLLETAVKESKDRVRAALVNCGYEFPAGRVTVNLAPADLPKEGGRFDLAIAIGILVAADHLPAGPFQATELYGELSLGGELHGFRGVLPTALQAARAGHAIILPQSNAAEAALARDGRIFFARHLLEVCRHARGIEALPIEANRVLPIGTRRVPDLAEVRGQPAARRALEIAAAGEHSLLLIGPPGAGKSMLAQRLPGILPPMSEDDALETAAVRSLSTRGFRIDEWRLRPFRCPHHTASGTALVGGGSHPRPGEISLAHNGVLFLDELPEFDRHVLEVLREPLESGHIVISRAARQAEFPARFQLVAAMNPCPCGHLGDARGRCRCAPERIESYRGRVSGPLLDRIDLHVEVGRVDPLRARGRGGGRTIGRGGATRGGRPRPSARTTGQGERETRQHRGGRALRRGRAGARHAGTSDEATRPVGPRIPPRAARRTHHRRSRRLRRNAYRAPGRSHLAAQSRQAYDAVARRFHFVLIAAVYRADAGAPAAQPCRPWSLHRAGRRQGRRAAMNAITGTKCRFGMVVGVVSGLVHVQAVVGRTEWEASVSATGAARYAVSRTSPPGSNGLARSLAIVYDSRRGNGLLGAGFQWVGVSIIECCRRSMVRDGFDGAVSFNAVPTGERAAPCSAALRSRARNPSIRPASGCGR